MREFPFIIDQAFISGLRPEEYLFDKQGFLEEAFNMEVSPAGLVEYNAPTDPFSGGQAVAFPFPQLFKTRDLSLMFSATTLWELGTGSTPWTKSAVTTYSISIPANTDSITSDGVWHFVDLGPAFYAFNGTSTVFRTGLGGLAGATEKTYVSDSVGINTGCAHRGRIFIGGLTNAWNSTWSSIFAEWEQEADLPHLDLKTNGPGSNWVMWSSIGGGDFPLWLIYPQGFGQLDLGPAKEFILERLQRNELGWAPLPFPGDVEVLKPLGGAVIAYQTDGIVALRLRGADIEFRTIADFGVQSRASVGGSEKQHFFIDGKGQLWSLTADLNLEFLGYEEFLSTMSVSSTLISFDEKNQRFFISDADKGYVWTAGGLTEVPDRLTSGIEKGAAFYALSTSSTSSNVRVQTGRFDNDRRALKYIHDVQLQYQDLYNVYLSILYRYDPTGAYTTLGPIKVNREGIVTFTVTATDYKLRVTATSVGDSPRIHRAEVRWSLVDKRAIRGLFGTQQ